MTVQRNEQFRHLKTKLAAFRRHEGGLTAVEFALIAPVFVFGFLTMADIGLAAHQRMTMDHVLRAGAQGAMADMKVENVKKVMAAAAAESFSVEGFPSAGKTPMSISATLYCVCKSEPNTRKTCPPACAASDPAPKAYYSMQASSTYTGMFISGLKFNPEILVQVR